MGAAFMMWRVGNMKLNQHYNFYWEFEIMKNEMTERKFIENDLLISGYSASDVASLTEHLNDETALSTPEWMLKDVKLEVAHALSAAWLVRRLRSLADASDAAVAMSALEQLVKISLHSGCQS